MAKIFKKQDNIFSLEDQLFIKRQMQMQILEISIRIFIQRKETMLMLQTFIKMKHFSLIEHFSKTKIKKRKISNLQFLFFYWLLLQIFSFLHTTR